MENKKLKTTLFFLPLFFVLFFSATPIKAIGTNPLGTLTLTMPESTTTPEPTNYGTIDDNASDIPAPNSITNTTTPTDTTDKGAGLELAYPQIPGVATPEYISVGIPAYVEYLFNLAVWAIGLIIFFVLLYQGFLYFTSAGNPGKLTDSIDGIKSAGLGAIILLSAYLIFNTINPQLTILNAPDLTIQAPTITPGIYLCNYKIGSGTSEDGSDNSISAIINRYTNAGDEDNNKTEAERKTIRDDRIKAAEELGALMVSRDKNKLCFRVNSTTNLSNFTFDTDGNRNTMFMIPRKEYVTDSTDSNKTNIVWKYDYGIIFHENDLRKGRCKIARKVFGESITGSVGETGFNARSVTLFTTPSIEPSPTNKGVSLFRCVNYNDKTKCPTGVTTSFIGSFPTATGGSMPNISPISPLSKYGLETDQSVKSIQFDPEQGSYFAVLFSENDYKGRTCEVINSNDPDLTDNSINQKAGGYYVFPSARSMMVIKGKVL
jgi:hypothetical protein